jgi:hypothetical protein
MDGYVDGDEYVFTTDHFSIYVLAEVEEAPSLKDPEDKGKSSTDDIPKTGDGTPIILFALLAILSGGFLIFMIERKIKLSE